MNTWSRRLCPGGGSGSLAEERGSGPGKRCLEMWEETVPGMVRAPTRRLREERKLQGSRRNRIPSGPSGDNAPIFHRCSLTGLSWPKLEARCPRMTGLFLYPGETCHTLVSQRQTARQRDLGKQKAQQGQTKDKCTAGLLERAGYRRDSGQGWVAGALLSQRNYGKTFAQDAK